MAHLKSETALTLSLRSGLNYFFTSITALRNQYVEKTADAIVVCLCGEYLDNLINVILSQLQGTGL